MGTGHDVRIAGPEDADEAGRILAQGFADDPVLTWLFHEPDRAGKLDAFFGFLAREALVPLGCTWLLPGSCAAWTPPDAPPWPEERSARFGELLSKTCRADELRRLGVLEEAMKAVHPEEPHWYLGTIASVPAERNIGKGSALLAASLRAVDEAALPAYLESSNPRNVPLYERFGFRATGSIDLPDGPSLTPMWRDPAS